MIVITFHFNKKKESLINIILTIKESDAREDAVIIKCKDETTLLKSFYDIFGLMKPEFITEYNGGGFDWRNVMTKVIHNNLLADMLQAMSLKELEDWEVSDSML